MKSKILLAILACCIFSYSASAQCFAYFSYSQSAVGTSVTFYVDSTAGATVNTVYSWTFGDGTAGTGSQLVHQYNSGVSAYTVCLTMRDTVGGCSSTTCDTIRLITGTNCSATVSYTHVDSSYTLAVTPSGAGPYNYTWTVDGQTASAAANPTINLPPSGTSYYVCVYVTDSTGCSASDCVYIFDTTAPVSTCSAYAAYTNVGDVYTFTASHVGGTPVSYAWYQDNTSLGAGTTATATLDSAALSAGTSVCVTITDANGCIATDCITLYNTPTGGGGCQAYFVIYPDSANGTTGYYSGLNLASGSFGSDILWDFGDGSTSTSQYPSHNYATPGQYIVCLSVGVAGTSCFDTYCDSSFYVFKTASGPMSHLSISAPTGINDVSAGTAIGVYPNPVNDQLTINTTATIDNERIYNISGQLVFERKNGTEINVSKFGAGIYILELSSGGALSRTKFIKQ